MEIKFTGLEDNEGTRKDRSVWHAKKIVGDKLDGGGEWKSGNIFVQDDNQWLLDKAEALELGDKVNVKHVKENGNWKISDIVPATGDGGGYKGGNKSSGGGGYKSSGGGGTGGSGMTKEDWAAKDKIQRESIARSVALKAAVDNTEPSTSPESIVEEAQIYEAYLLGGTPSGGDPLEPPK